VGVLGRRRGRAVWWHAAILLAAAGGGCARRSRLPEPPPIPLLAGTDLAVTLAWDAPVDLDLYVTEPGLETVYFANRKSAHGGALERDARCADDPGAGADASAPAARLETIRWAAPPPGLYRVAVDFIELCGDRRVPDVAYRVVVDADGRRQEEVGRAHVAERNPRAFEFTVGGKRR
jgi:hypothetical protein